MNFWKISTLVLVALLAVVVGFSVVQTASAERQPHMRAALTALREARDHLKQGSADKGGHRVKAIELTNAAIDEVQKGIAFDNRH